MLQKEKTCKEMNKKARFSEIFITSLLWLFTAAGITFILFAFYAGIDDILSMREMLVLTAAALTTAGFVFLSSRKLPLKTALITLIISLFAAAAVNFEFPELMKLPTQMPAENVISIADKEDNAALSVTWAYWFRPRSLNDDPFLTNPDRDISFSQLIKHGNWDEVYAGEDPVLVTQEQGASIGLPNKFRSHLAVLCLKAENNAVTVNISGEGKPITITPEMTAEQPYRVILDNGILPGPMGNAAQIFLWGGAFCFIFLCAILLYNTVRNYQGSHKHILIYSFSFIIPCLILLLLCIFLKITPFGEKSFLINDMWGEYADYMAYFRSILSGENDLLYSFSKSLGDDLPSLLAFYVINPLNWLVCAFKPEDLPLAVTLLVILRYGLAGLTAAVYFVNRRKCGFSALFFSTCYALMSFNIINAENTNLRESALVLPLVIMGLEQLIEQGKIQTYIWSLAAAIFLNFYSGYQICIFAAIYFLFFYCQKSGNTSFGKTLWRFIYSSLLAVGICAFLLIPVVLQLQNGPKSFDPDILKFRINMPWRGLFGKLLVSAYDVEQFKAEGLPNLYISLFCAILLPMYFVNPKIPAKKRGLTAGLLACFILIMQVNPLNLALHGFNQPGWWPYRYSFIICFLLLCIVQDNYAHRTSWTIPGLFLSAACFILLLWCLAAAGYDWMTANSLVLNSILLAASFILICFGFMRKDQAAPAILFVLTSLELFLNASHFLTINTAYERSNTVSDYVDYYTTNQPVFDEIRKMDDGFYRTEKNHFRTANDPMLFGYNGITHYSSTLNKDVMSFLPRAGFRYYPYRFLYWEGSDVSMDSLLGIKYLVSADQMHKPYSPVFDNGTYTVYENPYALPIMFTASPAVMEADLYDEKGGFEFQNQIFSALTGKRIEIFHPADSDDPVSSELDIQSFSADTCYVSDENEEEKKSTGSLSWNITAQDNSTLYAFFPAENIFPVTLRLNDKPFGRYFDNFSYHILRLGNFEKNERITLEMSPMEDRICIGNAQFYHENTNLLEEAVSMLREDETELRKISSSHLEGSFTASADRVLFFTIPYNSGWTIRIDGQKTPVTKVLGTFMAVEVPTGTHTIEMRYIPTGLIPGIIISLSSVAVALLLGKRKSATTVPGK